MFCNNPKLQATLLTYAASIHFKKTQAYSRISIALSRDLVIIAASPDLVPPKMKYAGANMGVLANISLASEKLKKKLKWDMHWSW